MAEEQDIQSKLESVFPFLAGKISTMRARRMFVELPGERFREVFDYAVAKMDFSILVTITGLDLGENLGAIYHLARNSGVMLNIQVAVPKTAPTMATISDVFPAADAYERELMDLLGFQVTGLVQGPRYPLTDDWPVGQFPLRKEWKASMLKTDAAKEEAKP